MKFGVELPHFGRDCTLERLVNASTYAEELGYDSVWVRDHLFLPTDDNESGGHGDNMLLDPLLTLSAVSSITSSITLGTNVLIPTRHPLKLSQNLGTLSFLSEGRVVAGLGAGTLREEFQALDLPYEERPRIIRETFEILRRTFAGRNASFHGELFDFSNITIAPRPVEDLPVWYGGGSFASVRRAVEYADGWCPPKLTFVDFFEKLGYLRELEAEAGREVTVCPKALVSVHKEHDKALDALDMEDDIKHVNRSRERNDQPLDERNGYYIAGTPEECAADLQRFADKGVDHFILDLRRVFDSVDYQMELFMDEVVPQIR